MNCPYCNEEMEPGFAIAHEALGWSRGSEYRARNPFINLTAYRPWRKATVPGHYCIKCQKIIMDVPKDTSYRLE